MSARRFAALVVLGVALIEAAWIALVPPFAGTDEFDHAFRAAAVSRGEWQAGAPAEAGRGQYVTVPADFAAAASGQCWLLPYTGVDNCFGKPTSEPGTVRIASAASSYNPVFYWVIGTVARPFHGVAALYAMRAATALIGLALIGAGVLCLCGPRPPGRLALPVVLALSPMVFFSLGVAAPNGPEMAAGFALWAALIGLLRRGPGTGATLCLWTAGAAAIVLANLRELGPGFVVITLVLAIALEPARARRVLAARPRAITAMGLLTLLSAGQAVYWALTHHGTASTDARGAWAWTHPLVWQFQMVGAFPLRNEPAPGWIYPVFLAIFLLYLGVAVKCATPRLRAAIVVLIGGVLAMPVVLTALTYSSVGVIWQGRYALPLAMGIPLLASEALATGTPRRLGLELAAVMAVLAAGLGCALGVRSIEISRSAAIAGYDWRPPSLVVIFMAFVAAAACFASVQLRRHAALRRLVAEVA